jgi:hypothetical protein
MEKKAKRQRVATRKERMRSEKINRRGMRKRNQKNIFKVCISSP